MKLSQFKQQLEKVSEVNFMQPGGEMVPAHFHITEAGLVTKHFVDCGGTVRSDKSVNFQVWVAGDTQHRLEPLKLAGIITTYEKLFGNEDLDVEIEYQGATIGRYGLDTDGKNFLLTTKQTDCLAGENCGVPAGKQKIKLGELQTTEAACCAPGGGCC